MDEHVTNGDEESTGDIDHPTNLVVLKEFGNIGNCVSEDEFMKIMPTTKFRKVKWALVYKYLKGRIVEGMEQEWRDMWKDEQLDEKLAQLEKQTEKCTQMGLPEQAWRPITGDTTSQLRIYDAIELQKQKSLLTQELEKCETRVAALKSELSSKRGHLRAVQLDLQQYHKIHSEIDEKISADIENHEKLIATLDPMSELKKE